jgi:DHA2 family multidrug resistance protein-like MFS transporter
MSETSMEFGIALGVAVLGVLGSAVYRAGSGAGAGDSLAAATASAAELPAEAAETVLAAARSAFTSGLVTVAGVCAVGLAALAVVAAAQLREVGTDEAAVDGDGSPAPVGHTGQK